MSEEPRKPKFYLNSDGTFPLDKDGKPMFVTEAQFKGCCCNMCQWRRRFEWDCEEEEWVEEDYGEEVETDGEWIPAERDPGESEELCTRTVWGEIVNCLVDPRPEPPPEPDPLTEEEIEECCPEVPSVCPCPVFPPDEWPCGGLFEQYTVSCQAEFTGPAFQGVKFRYTNLTVTANGVCSWSSGFSEGAGEVDYGEGEGFEPLDGGVSVSLTFFNGRWRWVIFPFFTVVTIPLYKSTGSTPTGSYKSISENGTGTGSVS